MSLASSAFVIGATKHFLPRAKSCAKNANLWTLIGKDLACYEIPIHGARNNYSGGDNDWHFCRIPRRSRCRKWRLHLAGAEVSPNDLIKIVMAGMIGTVVGSLLCVIVAALIMWKKGRWSQFACQQPPPRPNETLTSPASPLSWPMPTKSFPGALVQLASGGPIMTVIEKTPDNHQIECTWFDKADVRHTSWFGSELLVEVTKLTAKV
jgi:uncharacterized protein YodC (DUF2158 family)